MCHKFQNIPYNHAQLTIHSNHEYRLWGLSINHILIVIPTCVILCICVSMHAQVFAHACMTDAHMEAPTQAFSHTYTHIPGLICFIHIYIYIFIYIYIYAIDRAHLHDGKRNRHEDVVRETRLPASTITYIPLVRRTTRQPGSHPIGCDCGIRQTMQQTLACDLSWPRCVLCPRPS